MRIGLISDTHAPALGHEPPPEVARAFAGVDLILHAGDIYSSECLDWLERIAPVTAVEVPPAPVIGDPRVEERRIVQLPGHSIGLVHDLALRGVDEVVPGSIARVFPPGASLPAAVEQFFGAPVCTVVFGHTHFPVVERHQGILFVNPGSPTLPRQTRGLGTIAILELGEDQTTAEVIELATFRD